MDQQNNNPYPYGNRQQQTQPNTHTSAPAVPPVAPPPDCFLAQNQNVPRQVTLEAPDEGSTNSFILPTPPGEAPPKANPATKSSVMKRERFVRLATHRLKTVHQRLALLSNLSRFQDYNYSQGEIEQIVANLEQAFEYTKKVMLDNRPRKFKQ